jgi:murein DD-endopeptidase MepM/ murein hydrolase activator NlpD
MYPVKRFVSLSIATGLAVFTVVGSSATSQQSVLAQDVPLPQQRQLIAQRQSRIALVIGNAAYDEGALANPVNDATDIAKALEELGFEVILRQDLNKREMEEEIAAFSRKLRKGSVGVFYYAGHGVQMDGENYLVPLKARLLNEKDVRYDAVPLGKALNAMESAGNQVNIAIIDACRDNPFYRRWNRTIQGKGLTTVSPPSGIIIAYSTRVGYVAADGTGQRNSPFTSALLEYIKEPNLDIQIMFRFVSNLVNQKTSGKQEPWTEGNLRGDVFPLNPQRPSTPSISNLIPPEHKVTASTSNTSSDVKPSSASTPSTISEKMRAFLRVIRFAEGTDRSDGYNMMFTGLTFASYVDHPRQINCISSGLCSDAAGAYQALSTSWELIASRLNLKDFSPSNQDRYAIELIKELGAIPKIENDDFEGAIHLSCKIWASFPCSDSDNQSTTLSMSQLKNAWLYYLNNNTGLSSILSSKIGKLLSPTNGTISSNFGLRKNPITGEHALHNGVDFIAEFGTPIFAAESGEVHLAGYLSGYGMVVVIEHGNGLSTLYAHCSKIHVAKGDRVFKGMLIAAVGSTGTSTSPHLHFEVQTLRNGIWMPTDPIPFWDKAQ